MGKKNWPKLERLEVENFQSLAKANIELGAFTVIVGPSNSGKSALLRAVKATVRNVNNPSAVRVGKKLFTSALIFDGHRVSIERGKSSSTYRIELPNETEEVYTKSGKDVPEDVQRVLGLPKPDGPDLTFSSQIDPPFLLDATGSVAAKTLGDLTNVSKLHDAAREANRRRAEASKMETIRRADAQAVAERMKSEFSNLRDQVITVKECKGFLDQVRENAKKGETIQRLLETLQITDSAEQQISAQIAAIPKPADIEALAEVAGRNLGTRHRILDYLEILSKCAQAETGLTSSMKEAETSVDMYGSEYDKVLREHGTCPVCNQKVA